MNLLNKIKNLKNRKLMNMALNKLLLGKVKVRAWIKRGIEWLSKFIKWLKKFTDLKLQFLLVLATFFMAICIYSQTQIMKTSVSQQERDLQTKIEELSLSKRPYIYMEIKNVRIISRIEISHDNKATTHYMVQADIELKNEGAIPAIITNIDYYVTSDKDKRHLDTPSYFKENLGSYPYPTIVFPKQENLKFIYGADCSPATERIYFNVVISYKGYKDDKQYWYSFISKYATIEAQAKKEVKLRDGTPLEIPVKVFNIIPLQLEGNWDKEKNFAPPDVYVPDWESENKQVEKQRKFLY